MSSIFVASISFFMFFFRFYQSFDTHLLTPWKIYIEPENDGLKDDVPLELGDF